MKSQDKSIETLKLKATLELLIEKYGYERVKEVFISKSMYCKVPKNEKLMKALDKISVEVNELKAICEDEGITYLDF